MYNRYIFAGLFISSVVFAGDYEDWLRQQSNSFTSYKKSMDEEFAKMLKKDWEAFSQMYNPSPYVKPKPVEIPKIEPKKLDSKELENSKIVKPVIKTSIVPPIQKPKIVQPKVTIPQIGIDYFGSKLSFNYTQKMKQDIYKISKQTIVKYWEDISKVDTTTLLEQIKQTKSNFNLNDWGLYQLVNKISSAIASSHNETNLLNWYLLTKLGFDCKVGYNASNVYLISTTNENLYQVAFFKLDGKKYYVLTPEGKIDSVGKIFTYNGHYPKANQKVSMKIAKPFLTNDQFIQRDLSFKYDGKTYTIATKFNKYLVDFYKTYPQSSYEIYYENSNSPILTTTILKQLGKIVENKTELEAVNILLRFVQTAFAYKTDDQQFAYEKVMFAEETLFYPYSDCEDRSIMFSYLVRNILGLDVVGVKFSDHMAAAVSFSSAVFGDSFNYKGKKFVMADPTYINANTGVTMPQYKGKKFEVIGL